MSRQQPDPAHLALAERNNSIRGDVFAVMSPVSNASKTFGNEIRLIAAATNSI